MRMGREGESAAELVARLGEDELERLIRSFGEERFARRVARAIVAARQRAPIRRTGELAAIVRAAIPTREPGLDAATRTFQALRIAVNDELGELDRGLAGAERLLMPGGRLAVVSFHSLEDARVKSFLRERSGGAAAVSRHMPAPAPSRPPSFRLLGRRAVRPDADEVARNPRARSARLRAAERTSAPPWGSGGVDGGIRGRQGDNRMTRLGAVFWGGLVLASGFATFNVKYAVQGIDEELARVRRQTIAEQQEIRVLSAEWAYLNQPERLAELNRSFLQLVPDDREAAPGARRGDRDARTARSGSPMRCRRR